ncbi:MAG TPA: hypothetical protein HA283_00385 [Nanoarchaeota archaeon]|nr:hypothetical protein [Nanoarchaeota archaeon]HIH62730.1 hypothetical protein [Nanoarchaeota archaeon]HIJ09935.1 hypothetical protein [Nanoarchaeota archaeon]
MKNIGKKLTSRIPAKKETLLRLKKFQVNNDFSSYDKAINYLLDKFRGKNNGA